MVFDRFFFRRSSRVTDEPDAEIKSALERLAPIDGVGPQTSRLLRLCLDSDGYPRGEMFRALKHDCTLEEALNLESVSWRAREEIDVIAEIKRRRLAAEQGRT